MTVARRARVAAVLCATTRIGVYALATSAGAKSGSHARGYVNDGCVFVRDFLPQATFATICDDVRRLKGQMKPEKNSIAIGRLGRVLDSRSDAYGLLTADAVAARINRLAGQSPARPLVPSEYPIELRVYRIGAQMEWHVDDLLYDEPQCELVLVLDNTSDSETEFVDGEGTLHAEWTPPNSALLVRAGGARHRVQPLRRGERTILKMVWAVDGAERCEDRFHTHLDSMPGLRKKQRPKKAATTGGGARGKRKR